MSSLDGSSSSQNKIIHPKLSDAVSHMPKTKPFHSDELHPFSTVKGLLPKHDDLVGYPKGIRATRNPKDTVELSPLVELERGYRNEILLEIKKS